MSRKLAVSVAAVLTLIAVAAPLAAQRGDDAKRKSKNGRVEGVAGGVAVAIDYGRPKVGGRAIWGALVPYGKVWRTGADEATTVRFDRDVLVEGQKLAAGTYALFTIPTEGNWTVIFNRTAQQWGAYDYKEADDVLRVEVTPRAHDHVEELDFAVAGDAILLRWEKLEVPIAVRAAG
jgi:hypothetical protein